MLSAFFGWVVRFAEMNKAVDAKGALHGLSVYFIHISAMRALSHTPLAYKNGPRQERPLFVESRVIEKWQMLRAKSGS